MKLVIKSKEEIAKEIATLIANTIKEKSNCVLGLATGSSPIGVYQELIEMVQDNKISFKDVTSINLDEYVGLTGNDIQSYRYFMDDNFFNHIDISKENTYVPCGIDDLEENIRLYEQLIDEKGIDLQLLGIGSNGHIAFNEPNTPFDSLTHIVELTPQTRNDNARFFNHIDEVPTKALTMGLKSIMKAKKIVLIATGLNKALAIKKLIEENPSEEIPASILKFHLDCTIYADKEATSLLEM